MSAGVACRPKRHFPFLEIGQRGGQFGVQVLRATLRSLARGTSGLRQPQARSAAIRLVRATLDQSRLFGQVGKTAHSRRAEIQRGTGLAHERAVVLAQKKQQPCLGCSDAARGRTHLRPPLQPALSDIQ
ncbi:hypothetical protein HMPREF3115_25930 [Burkholderia sp. HMSC10F09]|nr:hypothetical protein HMPREF3115_25930 [Burkholderia sp. HMSC10F09]